MLLEKLIQLLMQAKAPQDWYGIYDDDTAEQWYDNGATPLSEAEFQAQLAALTGGAERVNLSEDDWHDNTAENRGKYLS